MAKFGRHLMLARRKKTIGSEKCWKINYCSAIFNLLYCSRINRETQCYTPAITQRRCRQIISLQDELMIHTSYGISTQNLHKTRLCVSFLITVRTSFSSSRLLIVILNSNIVFVNWFEIL